MSIQDSNVIEKLIDTIEEALDYYQYNCGYDDYYDTIKEKLDYIKEELENETAYLILKKPVSDFSEKEINEIQSANVLFLGTFVLFLGTKKHVYKEGTCVLLTLDQLDSLLKGQSQ